MFFQRIFTPGLSINSYLLGDEKTKHCVVIDPVRHVVPYIVQAQNAGFDITDILETHVHADFVSGAKELKHQLNEKPRIHASGMGGVEWIPSYADKIVQSGTQLMIGDLRLEAMHSPGHTPEHIMWICYDKTRSPTVPWFAFTGDCVFVGSVGRPDLFGKEMAKNLAKQLYHSLFVTLAPLPDFVEILPSHGAGTLCGQFLCDRQTSTMGYERLFNPYFRKEPEVQWIENLQKGLPAAPPYFRRLKRMNVEGPPLLSSLKTIVWGKNGIERNLKELFLVDVRHPEVFASSHLVGSLNIPLSPYFCHWVGWMLPERTPLGLVIENIHIAPEVVEQLRLIGFDQEIWIISLDQEEEDIHQQLISFPLMDVEELMKQQSTSHPFYILDVRTPAEWLTGHIPGAHHLELNELEHSLDKLPREQPIVTICISGSRSSLAASLLEKHGFPSVINVRGGMQAWKQYGLALTYEKK